MPSVLCQGLAVPSDIGVLGEGRSGEDADGDDMQGSGTVEVGGPLSMSEKGAARPGKRWWLPERMRSNLEDAVGRHSCRTYAAAMHMF